jgi:hypothetical protein
MMLKMIISKSQNLTKMIKICKKERTTRISILSSLKYIFFPQIVLFECCSKRLNEHLFKLKITQFSLVAEE